MHSGPGYELAKPAVEELLRYDTVQMIYGRTAVDEPPPAPRLSGI